MGKIKNTANIDLNFIIDPPPFQRGSFAPNKRLSENITPLPEDAHRWSSALPV